MVRFGINLNPFVLFINQFKITSFTVQHLAMTAELEQVDALSLFYDQNSQMIDLESVKILSKTGSRFLNIHTEIGSESYRDLIDVKPSMISFSGQMDKEKFTHESARIQDHAEMIEDAVHTIKSNDIMCSIVIEPDIREVKAVAKYPFDYIELNLSKLNTATDLNHELEELENLKMAVLAAEKYGMGIQCSGQINSDNIEHIQQFPQIEEVYSDRHLFERAMIKGLSEVIQEYRSLFKHSQIHKQ